MASAVGLAVSNAKNKKSKWFVFAANAMFYIMIAVLLVCVFLFASTRSSAPFSIFGISAMHMPTASMQSEIPQDSLVIARHINSETLQIGDDIAFFMGPEFVVVRRIIDTHENNAANERNFITRGVENTHADREIVPHANVIGKVIFHNAHIGAALLFARQNVIISVVLGALVFWFFAALRSFAKEPRKP
jgi:signal peptidase I